MNLCKLGSRLIWINPINVINLIDPIHPPSPVVALSTWHYNNLILLFQKGCYTTICIDGNFSLVHKKSAGFSVGRGRMYDSKIFIPKEEVAEFFVPSQLDTQDIEVLSSLCNTPQIYSLFVCISMNYIKDLGAFG